MMRSARYVTLTCLTALGLAWLMHPLPVSADFADSHCAQADYVRISLPQGAEIDEIQVEVGAVSEVAQATVTVTADTADRVLRLTGPSPRRLRFSPPLVGSVFDVAIDPVFTAKEPACVKNVLLLEQGMLVAQMFSE